MVCSQVFNNLLSGFSFGFLLSNEGGTYAASASPSPAAVSYVI
jgi:hypothetical protein